MKAPVLACRYFAVSFIAAAKSSSNGLSRPRVNVWKALPSILTYTGTPGTRDVCVWTFSYAFILSPRLILFAFPLLAMF